MTGATKQRRNWLSIESLSVRKLLLISSIGLTSVALLAIVSLVVSQMAGTLTRNTGQSFASLAQFNRERFTEEVTAEIELLQTLARDQTLSAYMLQNSEEDLGNRSSLQLDTIFKSREQQWKAGASGNFKKGILVNPASKKLGDFMKAFPGHHQLLLTNTYGALIATAGPEPNQYYYKDSTWQHPNLSSGANVFFVGEPEVGTGDQTTTVALAVPILIPNTGVIRGYLYTRYLVADLKIFKSTAVSTAGGQLAIVNKSGQVVYDTTAANVGSTVTAPVAHVLAGGDNGWGTALDSARQEIIFGHANLRLNQQEAQDPLGWSLMVRQPKTQALAVVNNLIQASLLISLVILVIVVLVGLWLTNQMTRPISQLTNVARALSSGNFDTQAPTTGPSELRILGSVFNEMTAKLQQYYTALQTKIVELNASVTSLPLGFIIASTGTNNETIVNPTARQILDLKPGASLADTEAALRPVIDLHALVEECIAKQDVITIEDTAFGSKFLRILLAPVSLNDPASQKSKHIGVVVLIEDTTTAKIMDRSKAEFFSIASHELRTPLTAIRGNSSMIEQLYATQVKDPDFHQMLGDIHTSSVRLIDIVNDFLDASSLEQDKLKFSLEPASMSEIAGSVVSEMAVTAQVHHNKLAIEHSPAGDQPVNTDKNRVKQILYNLLGNALRFTEGGSVTISFAVDGQFLKTSISDTGIGISEQNQQLLFHKFQQASDSILTRDTNKGTGLGLYISRLLVEKMGGTLVLDRSEMGKGSVFSFRLPLTPEGAQSSSQTDNSPAPAATAPEPKDPKI